MKIGDLVKDLNDYTDCNAAHLSGRIGIIIRVMNQTWNRIPMVRVMLMNGDVEDYELHAVELLKPDNLCPRQVVSSC